ncbi:SURF1 family cytochrome oxidase biogenesis protein [Neorickettsia sennetsu]|uniref:SURF1-like protein n=1 Tax=Ehrlichia sennetsu (strain ATCC VR-367 / Miyayama) TaxID=222891 RepID=Q2GEX9_EHRS3|nr:SURF1 family cytochrome oxidase biogenesis protein [Neorickettsia sennetsu]ABD45674.1 putative lipoprotein [Neorickettsia sennetsu str. Miyayama]
MEKAFVLCILISFFLGCWQVKRFLFKREAYENITTCHATTLGDPRKYCNFVGKLSFYEYGDIYLLYKDSRHFNILVPFAAEGKVVLVNVGYVRKEEKDRAREMILQILKSHKEFVFKGYLSPVRGSKIPLVRNDVTNLELYSLDMKEIGSNFRLPVLEYILYSTSNDFIAIYPEMILSLQRPQLKIMMHFWYAFMWYAVACIGLIYYFFGSRKIAQTSPSNE